MKPFTFKQNLGNYLYLWWIYGYCSFTDVFRLTWNNTRLHPRTKQEIPHVRL